VLTEVTSFHLKMEPILMTAMGLLGDLASASGNDRCWPHSGLKCFVGNIGTCGLPI